MPAIAAWYALAAQAPGLRNHWIAIVRVFIERALMAHVVGVREEQARSQPSVDAPRRNIHHQRGWLVCPHAGDPEATQRSSARDCRGVWLSLGLLYGCIAEQCNRADEYDGSKALRG